MSTTAAQLAANRAGCSCRWTGDGRLQPASEIPAQMRERPVSSPIVSPDGSIGQSDVARLRAFTAPAPVIASISPSSIPASSLPVPILIRGKNFFPFNNTWINWGVGPNPADVFDSERLIVTLPPQVVGTPRILGWRTDFKHVTLRGCGRSSVACPDRSGSSRCPASVSRKVTSKGCDTLASSGIPPTAQSWGRYGLHRVERLRGAGRSMRSCGRTASAQGSQRRSGCQHPFRSLALSAYDIGFCRTCKG